MCGRYTLTSSGKKVRDTFDLAEVPELAPRYNIAPTQEAILVRKPPDGDRRAERASWGFRGSRRLLINARAETVSDKPSFAESYRRRRCLVPADGFYEWRRRRDRRLPFHFTVADGEPFALAGLWKPTLDEDRAPGLCFTILTVPANEIVAEIHPRMPLLLDPEGWNAWLAPETPRTHLEPMLRPWPSRDTRVRAVSTAVNDVANDSPDCLADPEPPGAVQLDLLT